MKDPPPYETILELKNLYQDKIDTVSEVALTLIRELRQQEPGSDWTTQADPAAPISEPGGLRNGPGPAPINIE